MITKKPWFGPKYLGWGWRPITWEGWLALLIWLGLLLLAVHFFGVNWLIIVGLVIVLCVFCYLTGGKPGSEWLK
ncbi:MAG TPA: hypothetical protein VMQ44_01335 [Candidatus Saccharimonadales bacterium]|nr:hypothetical protein [Candidatus Saccharimonadales bacterium]